MDKQTAARMTEELWAELMKLTVAERIQLAMSLWDSVPPEDFPPLTDEEIEELERRLAEHEKDPGTAIPWEEVRAQLRARLNELRARGGNLS
jgi:putative addiction module component (TIGR02574 family)